MHSTPNLNGDSPLDSVSERSTNTGSVFYNAGHMGTYNSAEKFSGGQLSSMTNGGDRMKVTIQESSIVFDVTIRQQQPTFLILRARTTG